MVTNLSNRSLLILLHPLANVRHEKRAGRKSSRERRRSWDFFVKVSTGKPASHCAKTQRWWCLDSAQKMLIHFLWQIYWFYKVSIVTPYSQGCVQQMIHIKYKKNFQKESPVSGITEMKFHIKLQD